MIKVTLSYPRVGGATFDYDYYVNVHLPFASATFTELGMLYTELDLVERQVRADEPDLFAVTNQYWNSISEAESAFSSPRIEEVRADAHNFYSGGPPTVRFSSVVSPEASNHPLHPS